MKDSFSPPDPPQASDPCGKPRPLPPAPSPEDATRQEAMIAAAAAAGAAAANQVMEEQRRHHRRHRRGRLRRKLIGILLLLVLLTGAAMFLWPKLQKKEAFSLTIDPPSSLTELLPDEKMGYNTIDFAGAVLGEAHQQRKLIVLKQDLVTTNRITQALANLSLFAKTKIIRSYGTGQYTVDLMGLTTDDIDVDDTLCIVTITIPHAVLDEVIFDVNKTEFGDTERNWLAFGEIKMTAEQQQTLEQSVMDDMKKALQEPSLMEKADERALYEVRQIYQPLISGLSDAYIVKIIMEDGETAAPVE